MTNKFKFVKIFFSLIITIVLTGTIGINNINIVKADTISVVEDGVKYLLDDTTYTATVTGRENDSIVDINIRETIDYNAATYRVTAIGDNAFSYAKILHLSMPDSIITIGNNAFSTCGELTGDIKLPNNLVSIGNNAFISCPNIAGELVLPDSLVSIGNSAFSTCKKLTSDALKFPDGLVSIGEFAFYACEGLTGELSFPSSLKSIGKGAFSRAGFTGKVVIPHHITYLGGSAFATTSLYAEYDSFKKLAGATIDLDSLSIGLPDTDHLENRLESQYEDTVNSSTDKTVLYKSANADEIEINYAQAAGGFDFLFVMDTSGSMQNEASIVLDSVEYMYPRSVYTSQILDDVSKQLLNTNYNNRVAITTFSYGGLFTWNTNGFISDAGTLSSMIWDNFQWFGSNTDYSYGLQSAINLINARSDNSRPVVVIFLSDGEPNEGHIDTNGVYGGDEAKMLKDMGVPIFPVSIFLADAELNTAREALTSLSYNQNIYYEARDVNTFQTIIAEVVKDAVTVMGDTVIVDELSNYFELATGTEADLSTESGTAYIDNNGKIIWNLSGCDLGVLHTLHIKIKVIEDEISETDYYPTNKSLDIEEPWGTELPESPKVYIIKDLETSKNVTDANEDGIASAGEELAYTIKAKNKGDVVIKKLFIQDNLESVIPYVKNITGTIVTINIDGTITTKAIEELIDGFAVDLAAGSTVTVTFNITVLDNLDVEEGTKIVNKATIGNTTPEAVIPIETIPTYTVTYNANGGSGSHQDTGLPYGGNYTVLGQSDTEISRDGYIFKGWNTAADGSGTSYEPEKTFIITKDMTLYAQWEKESAPDPVPDPKYTVTYNANGGSGSHQDTGLPYGDNYTVRGQTDTGINRDGYIFKGWNTAADGSGTSYEPEKTFIITRDMTLYAQWEKESAPDPVPDPKYTVTYNANGGSGSHQDTGLPYGDNYTVRGQIDTGINRNGYIFKGWNTAADGSGISYASGNMFKIRGDVTLYAQWEDTSPWGKTDPNNPHRPKTGDTSNIWPWIIVLCISLSGMVYLIYSVFHQKKNRK